MSTSAENRTPDVAASGLDAFQVFGLERHFSFDRSGIQRRYYQLSRDFHPDRVAAEGPDAQMRAAREMSALNSAYEILTDPIKTREHVLELEGLADDRLGLSKGAIPIALAESWFEIQEVVLEEPPQAGVLVTRFEERLKDEFKKNETELLGLESAYDRSAADQHTEVLAALRNALRTHNYLVSLQRDVDRLKLRLSALGVGA